jgi:hypothetical protein
MEEPIGPVRGLCGAVLTGFPALDVRISGTVAHPRRHCAPGRFSSSPGAATQDNVGHQRVPEPRR